METTEALDDRASYWCCGPTRLGVAVRGRRAVRATRSWISPVFKDTPASGLAQDGWIADGS